MSVQRIYDKPARQVIVDLINRVLVKQFNHLLVTITPAAGAFEPHQCIQLDTSTTTATPKDRVLSSFVAQIDGYQNQLFCNYYRLKLDHHIPNPFAVGSLMLTNGELLQQLRERYGVYFDESEVDFVRYSAPHIDESGGFYYEWLIRPKANHLVWVNDLRIKIVPSNHLLAKVPCIVLGTINPFGQPGLPGVILHRQLPGLTIESLTGDAQ